ncbi:MAG: FliM/FliN family flagellar motor switch protein [Bryobacteraceae bacterium]|jgi:flagellar motor switch protein FliM
MMPANQLTTDPETTPVPEGSACEPLVPGRLAREVLANVENVHKFFLQSAAAELSELLDTPVAMDFQESAQSSLSEALNHSESAGIAIALDLSPLSQRGLLTFPCALLFRVLDILLAVPESRLDDPGRSVTAIELYILREFFDVFASALRSAWEPFYPAAFNRISLPPEESAARAAEWRNDLALILSATVRLAEVSADVHLIVPAFLARLAHLKSTAAIGPAAEPVRVSVLNCLADATLRMDAVLEGASIRIRDLLDLAPGRILTVGNAESSSFDCLLNGKRRFTGQLVSSGGRCGIQIGALLGGTGSQFMRGSAADR